MSDTKTPATEKKKVAADAVAAAKAAKAAPKPAAKAADDDTPTVHGAAVNQGDINKGGTAKSPLPLILPLTAIILEKGHNPRIHLDEEKIKELAKDIKVNGLLQPISVRPVPNKDGKFSLIAGERRFRAVGLLEHTTIPVMVRTDLAEDPARAKAAAIAENEVREGLNPVELGRAFADLRSTYQWTPAKIATETGVNHQKVRRCLDIMETPKDIQTKVSTGEISLGAALEYAALDEDQRKALKDAMKPGVSAAEIKAAAKQHAREAEKASKGEVTHDGKAATRKKGAERSKSVAAWRGNREKQGMIGLACSTLLKSEAAGDDSSPDYHAVVGAVTALLWSRGDLNEIFAPTKDNKAEYNTFRNLLASEAKVYDAAHPTDQTTEGVGEGGEEGGEEVEEGEGT